MKSTKKNSSRNVLVTLTLLALLWSILLITSCSDDGKKDNSTPTFDVTVNFAEFAADIEVQEAGAKAQVTVVWIPADGVERREVLANNTQEGTVKIPENALIFGVLSQFRRPNDESGLWRRVQYEFIFNHGLYTDDGLDELVPRYIPKDFKNIQNVLVEVNANRERHDVYINETKVDLENRTINLKANPSHTTGPAIPDFSEQFPTPSVQVAFSRFNESAKGWEYTIVIPDHNYVHTGHVHGMGFSARNSGSYYASTKGDPDMEGGRGVVYLSWYDTKGSEYFVENNGNVFYKTTGGQAWKDVYVFGATDYDQNHGIFMHANGSFTRLIARDQLHPYSAVGVTRVRGENVFKGRNVDHFDDPGWVGSYKYIIAVGNNDIPIQDGQNDGYYYFDLYISTPTSFDLSELDERYFKWIGQYPYADAGRFNNIALFVDNDGTVLLLGFDFSRNTDDHMRVVMYDMIVGTYLHGNQFQVGGDQDLDIYRKPRNVRYLQKNKSLMAKSMDGEYGATAYFDGNQLHIFATEQDIDDQESWGSGKRNIDYQHYSSGPWN